MLKRINCFLIILLLSVSISPSETSARNINVPQYNGDPSTHLKPDQMRKIQLNGDFVIRASKEMVNGHLYKGVYHYPTFYRGKVGDSDVITSQDMREP